MISLEQARRQILETLQPLPAETVTLSAALGRVTASPVKALLEVPGFDNASVDGYAVRSGDTAGASREAPARLRRIGEIRAGHAPPGEVHPGTAIRIFTGGMLPGGADSVVMQEDTRIGPGGDVEILAPTTPWENVRFTGEDVRRDAVLVPAGRRLGPAHLGLLAAAGIVSLSVHRRPRVSLLTTGDELREPGRPLGPGQLVDSNRFLLSALATAAGADVKHCARLSDELEATRAALTLAASDVDLLVTAGGVSVGDADVVKAAVAAAGGTVELWRIAMKPGKPFAWGRLGGAWWFGLPGNPVSAYVTWHVLVGPALRRLEGDPALHGRRGTGRLAERVHNRGPRRHFLRVTIDPDGAVRLAGTQASHLQSSLAAANALLDIPADTAWDAGREVQVDWLD